MRRRSNAGGILSTGCQGLGAEVEALREEVGDGLNDAERGASAWGAIERATDLPTADQLWRIDRAWERLPPVVERPNALLAERLRPLLGRVLAEALQPDPGEAVAVPGRRRGGR